MTIGDDLLRKVTPLYDVKPTPPKTWGHYPRDLHNKRWCKICLSWKPLTDFKLSDGGRGRGRDCKPCRRQLLADRNGKR